MIAIRISGMLWPAITSAKTSLGFGHGDCVDIRTVMYEIRNEPKMNVSESRKIHIIALPQGTFLNARWSDDQSATMPGSPSLSSAPCAVLASAVCVMGSLRHLGCRAGRRPLSMGAEQHEEERRPDEQQIVPIQGAK